MVDFSVRLRELRAQKHLTQAQVAARVGVTASMISSYETDIRLPSYEVLIRLANLYGVSVDYLLGRTDVRALDVSGLSEDEVAVISDMVNLLRKRV